ncbi:NAD-dependent epimerase/dehydratase family protein, partial [Pseudomonas aeruginosa]|uniref:NAD-dependent epimerase/dehydratase family protein n=1 Tax=Pseudomonas aeruginosa TaxID=287 RepID=UPI0031B6C237
DLPETYLERAVSSHYASSKYAAEQVIAGAVSRYSATRFILLRPRGLFGPHDQVIVPRLMQQLQQGGGCLRLQYLMEGALVMAHIHGPADQAREA